MSDVAIPTFDVLQKATVTYNGSYVTVLFRDRDRTSTQFKQMVSFQLKVPVQLIFQSGTESTVIEWWVNGVHYNPFGPAKVSEGLNGYEETHHLPDGSLGRNDGPAFVSNQFGVQFVERWTPGKSQLHRVGGPALSEIDYGDPATDTWANFSRRLNFQKVGLSDDNQGTVIKRRELSWYQRGKCRNDDGWAKQMDFTVFERFEVVQPMGIMRTAYVTQRELRWYDENEKLHRVDGPAIIKMKNVREIEKDGKMAKWQCESHEGQWYVRGSEIPKYEILKWAKKNHIPLLSEPCYDRSAFMHTDGELCFITDLAKEFLE